MSITHRSKPYTLDLGDVPSLEDMRRRLQDLLENVDTMFRQVYQDLNAVESAITALDASSSSSSGTTVPSVVQGDLLAGSGVDVLTTIHKSTSAKRYLANTGASNQPAWDQVDLATGVTGRLPFADLTAATGATKLLGRGAGSGAGDFQEIAIGSGLSMSGTTLSSTGSSGAASGSNFLTNGDLLFPEFIFAGGDVVTTS
jgi:hypothetical protein